MHVAHVQETIFRRSCLGLLPVYFQETLGD